MSLLAEAQIGVSSEKIDRLEEPGLSGQICFLQLLHSQVLPSECTGFTRISVPPEIRSSDFGFTHCIGSESQQALPLFTGRLLRRRHTVRDSASLRVLCESI